MTDAMVYATGAWPDYDPRMAESILVERFPDHTAWGIFWTDTSGSRHGRVFEYRNREALDRLRGGEPDKVFPLALASTQAGCVWAWMAPDGTETASLQRAHEDLPLSISEGDWRHGGRHNKGLHWEAVDNNGDGLLMVYTAGGE